MIMSNISNTMKYLAQIHKVEYQQSHSRQQRETAKNKNNTKMEAFQMMTASKARMRS